MKKFTNDNSQQMVDMQAKIWGINFMSIEGNLSTAARKTCPDYDGGSWALITDDAETTGFMYPTGADTYAVGVATNGYDNPAMSSVAFGAALTIMVTNHMSWVYHERGQDNAAQTMAKHYERVRDFVFDLSDADKTFMDGAAVAGFID